MHCAMETSYFCFSRTPSTDASLQTGALLPVLLLVLAPQTFLLAGW